VNDENKARCFNFGNFTLDLERRLLLRDGAPAWSPDGKMIVAERGTETGDIVLINK
jgi:hypothetical protein